MFALALGAIFAHKLGYIDGDTVIRLVTGMNGLMDGLVRQPDAQGLSSRAPAPARPGGSQAWSMVLSGLVYAGLWAFAPIPVAIWGGRRVWRGRGDARLLPVAAGQGESRLIQAFFEAAPRRQEVRREGSGSGSQESPKREFQ